MKTTTTGMYLKATGSRRAGALLAASLIALLAVGCGGPPGEALKSAEDALVSAAFAKDCANESYELAERMLIDARRANLEGDYETARKKAEASRLLAEQAKQQAELNREDCEKRKRLDQEISEVIQDTNPPKGFETTAVVERYELKTIYFPFNEATLTPEAQQILADHADWLSRNAEVRIIIEGHTDDTGSIEYNLALSHRRAQAVKQYLKRLGVDAPRMKIVPYGEEKPEQVGENESAKSRNRRAAFVTR